MHGAEASPDDAGASSGWSEDGPGGRRIAEDEGSEDAISAEVGQRLRAIRRSRGWTLEEVERRSGGRWSASAIGAYERGFRNLSLPRLRAVAAFYDVPIGVLLGEADVRDRGGPATGRGGRLVLDLAALGEVADAEPIWRYLRSIIVQRGDWNGRILSVRQDDVRALCAMLRSDEDGLLDQLRRWGALVG
jgi:transcriptional regulator with XRE-family HTH domain